MLEGETLVRERGNLPRTYLPSQAAGLYHIEDRFSPDATEALYGLGQHQSGMFNYRGSVVELGQNNTDIAIPLLVSSKGYAIFWNTASFSYVDNRFPLELNLESMAAPQIDYYVLYGPQMDAILHQYRSMTGHAPLFPEWAYGLFQSKDRYKTQPEILSIAAEYRSRHIPMDAIVQDWYWWKEGGKGDPIFNSGYTDVPAELKTLHDEHVHAMISAWAMMDATAENFKQIVAKGFDVPGAQIYDPSNPAAADFFWNQFVGKLFAQGWDAFWLDSSEPEEAWPYVGDAILRNKQLHIGPGLEYTNVFPLLHTGDVQERWKQANPEQARLPAHALGLHGPAAQWRRGMVRRCVQQLVGAAPPGAGGPQLRALRLSLLDDGHRRLPSTVRRPILPARLSGALRALVRVRRLLPRLPHPRPSRFERAMDLRQGLSRAAGRRPPALPAAALRLFAGVEGDERGLHHPAAAGDGFPRRIRPPGRSATSSCSGRRCW